MNSIIKTILPMLAVFSLACLMSAPAWADAESEYRSAVESAAAFEKNTKRHKYRDAWLKVIERFEKIAEKYPGTKRGCDALYNAAGYTDKMADVSRLRDDRRKAASTYEKLAGVCPSSSLADDGLYNAGQINLKIGDYGQARSLFARCIKKFPKGDMRSKAAKALEDAGGSPEDAVADEVPAGVKAQSEGKSLIGDSDKLIVPRKDSRLLTKIEYSSSNSSTEVRLFFNYLPAFTQGEIPEEAGRPRRLYFDFANTKITEGEPTEYFPDDGRVKMIRLGMFQTDTLRLVFELSHWAGKFSMQTDIDPARTVIVIHSKPGSDAPQQAEAVSRAETSDEKPRKSDENKRTVKDQKEKKTPAAAQDVKKSPPAEKKIDDFYAVKTITIDPGHGGKDDGAVGPGGTKEKDVVLKICKYLEEILKKRYGVKVVMTRTTDREVGLDERAEIANKAGSDLFLSIHANAIGGGRRDIYGIETYYLNNSKDSYSRRLAERENNSLGHRASDLEFILADLSMNVNVADSIKLATYVQQAMVGNLQKQYSLIADRGVGRAVFYVLLNTRMPSILVETSFISNPREEARLKNPTYQKRLAEAIASGVGRYIDYQKQLAKQMN